MTRILSNNGGARGLHHKFRPIGPDMRGLPGRMRLETGRRTVSLCHRREPPPGQGRRGSRSACRGQARDTSSGPRGLPTGREGRRGSRNERVPKPESRNVHEKRGPATGSGMRRESRNEWVTRRESRSEQESSSSESRNAQESRSARVSAGFRTSRDFREGLGFDSIGSDLGLVSIFSRRKSIARVTKRRDIMVRAVSDRFRTSCSSPVGLGFDPLGFDLG